MCLCLHFQFIEFQVRTSTRLKKTIIRCIEFDPQPTPANQHPYEPCFESCFNATDPQCVAVQVKRISVRLEKKVRPHPNELSLCKSHGSRPQMIHDGKYLAQKGRDTEAYPTDNPNRGRLEEINFQSHER